ncbi:MAG: hypothetical protein AAB305_06930 [Candidatus Zixiibacteriota bacterium]
MQFDSYRLWMLPHYAKVFVGLFTTLMLCVCFWASWIFYLENGRVEESNLPAHVIDQPSITGQTSEQEGEPEQDIEEILTDSSAVMAPIWDETHRGEEQRLDSADLMLKMQEQEKRAENQQREADRPPLRENIGLAHTHINGQSLLFFALGLIFLFTSVSPKIKTAMVSTFGLAVILHNIGLSGRGFSPVFDDILAISGVLILFSIVYMALMIFAELAKGPHESK